MDNLFMLRAGIFLIAGLVVILYPKQVNIFQNYVLEKLHTKYRVKNEKKPYYHVGIIFIIIAIILFIYSITH